MSIIEKIFKKNANKGIQQKTLESKITEPQQSQTVSSKMGSAEDHLKIAQDKTHDDRIAYYFFHQRQYRFRMDRPSEKALLYYLVARSVDASSSAAAYHNSALKLAFYAAQLFYNPDQRSGSWQAFIEYGFKPSKENAARLHEAYPLPQNIEKAQTYQAPIIRNKETSTPNRSIQRTSKNVRHIVCLCYDSAYTLTLKSQIMDFIVNSEKDRGSIITATSRITTDSFYDNENLDKPDLIRRKIGRSVCQSIRLYCRW